LRTRSFLAYAAPLAAFIAGALTAGWSWKPAGGRIGTVAGTERAWADAPVGSMAAMLGALQDLENLHALAALGTALSRLTPVEIGSVFERMEKNPSYFSEEKAGWLFTQWLKRDSEAAMAWLRPFLAETIRNEAFAFDRDSMRAHVIKAWAAAQRRGTPIPRWFISS